MDSLKIRITKNIKRLKFLKSNRSLYVVNFILLLLLIFSLGFNQLVMAKTQLALGIKNDSLGQAISKTFKKSSSNSGGVELSGDIMEDSVKLVISQGVPAVYGQELGVSFDEVQASINIMRQYDPTHGKENKITLAGDDLKRYIDVGLKISCEYCCSAKSIIKQDGQAACGCAHSIAMRGLLAYLIQNHGDEYTDDKLLRELARWKGMYFPKQMIKKLAGQLQGAQFTPDTAALVIDADLPDYGGGNAPLPSEIENLPGMVGGC